MIHSTSSQNVPHISLSSHTCFILANGLSPRDFRTKT